MTNDTKDFLKSQVDKFLLVGMIMYFTGFMMVLLWRFPNLDAGTLQWIEKSVDMATGALIGSVTAASLMRRSESASETVTKGPMGATVTRAESSARSEMGGESTP